MLNKLGPLFILLPTLITGCGSFKSRQPYSLTVEVDNKLDSPVHFKLEMNEGGATRECEDERMNKEFTVPAQTTDHLELVMHCRNDPPRDYDVQYNLAEDASTGTWESFPEEKKSMKVVCEDGVCKPKSN